MKQPLYKQAFLHSWKLAIKHVWLWPLGLFAAVLGQLGVVDFMYQSYAAIHGDVSGTGGLYFFSLLKEFFASTAIPVHQWGWVAFLVIALSSLFLFFVFVSVVSQGALIHVAARSVKRKQLPDVTTSWHVGRAHFWRVFSLVVLKKLVFIVLGVVIAIMSLLFLLNVSFGSLMMFFLVFLVCSFLGITVSMLTVYGMGYVIVEEYRFFEAIRAAWKLFRSHMIVSLEVSAMVFLFDIGILLVLLLGFFILLIPAFIAFFVAATTKMLFIFSIGLLISALLYLLFSFFVISVFSVYVTSIWTYLFMKMHKEGIVSRIKHWLR